MFQLLAREMNIDIIELINLGMHDSIRIKWKDLSALEWNMDGLDNDFPSPQIGSYIHMYIQRGRLIL